MVSVLDRDLIPENFLSELEELRRRVAVLERLQISTAAADGRYLRREVRNANVANPPTLAELDEAFGPAATLPNPFFGVLDDSGAGTNVYMCIAVNGRWQIEILTLIS